jgi:hypothetical protein
MKTMTIAEVTVTNDQMKGVMPEFGRWRDVEELFGIKRGTLYNLMAEGKIKSVSIRRRGNVHGCRLIHLQSVRDYLQSLLETETEVSSIN